MRSVDFYFDFISPYSWFALVAAEDFAVEHGVEFRLRPVVFAVLLDATGLIGPAEVRSKRTYTIVDVYRTAQSLGLKLVGPPAHPFRSLEALRLVTSELHGSRAFPLALALARGCWEGGRDLTDMGVLTDVAAQVGIDTTDLEKRIASPDVKAALRATTADALHAGVFGVPTFACGPELFWGHDRMPQLADLLRTGRKPIEPSLIQRMLNRPRGADRKSRPDLL